MYMKHFLVLMLLSVINSEVVIFPEFWTGDVISPFSFECFNSRNITHLIFLVMGNDTTRYNTNIKILESTKFNHMTADLFLILSTRSSLPASAQVNNLMNAIPSNLYQMIWLHVSEPTENATRNCLFLIEALQTIKSRGKRPGVYSIWWIWQKNYQNTCNDISGNPLWYVNTDGHYQNFDDFTPFGGWTKPSQKTYDHSPEWCQVTAHFIYRP